jgi:hypothetical protein
MSFSASCRSIPWCLGPWIHNGMRHFTYEEAQAKLDQVVCTRVPGQRIPQGTKGRVLYARWEGEGYALGDPWALTLAPLTFTVRLQFPGIALTRRPVVDWVRKDQWHYLDEIAP